MKRRILTIASSILLAVLLSQSALPQKAGLNNQDKKSIIHSIFAKTDFRDSDEEIEISGTLHISTANLPVTLISEIPEFRD